MKVKAIEHVLGAPKYTTIGSLEVINKDVDHIIYSTPDTEVAHVIPFIVDAHAAEHPLVAARGCYISQYSDDVPLGSRWSSGPEDEDEPASVSYHQSIANIVAKYEQKKELGKIPPQLVGTITTKYRIHPTRQPVQRYPFNFTMVVADSTTSINVVVWNARSRDYFRKFNVGDVVVIEGYKLKAAYTGGGFEVSVNPSKPRGYIKFLKGL